MSDLEANARGSVAGDVPTPSAPSPEKRKFIEDEVEEETPEEQVGPSAATGHPDCNQVEATPSQLTSPTWTPSPALAPQQSNSSYTSSAWTSPAILPTTAVSRDLDHEATEALLMLTKDRRGSSARGMSVKDLLTP